MSLRSANFAPLPVLTQDSQGPQTVASGSSPQSRPDPVHNPGASEAVVQSIGRDGDYGLNTFGGSAHRKADIVLLNRPAGSGAYRAGYKGLDNRAAGTSIATEYPGNGLRNMGTMGGVNHYQAADHNYAL